MTWKFLRRVYVFKPIDSQTYSNCLLIAFPSPQSNDDLFNMHQAISHLTELEEEVLDMHKVIYEVSFSFLPPFANYSHFN